MRSRAYAIDTCFVVPVSVPPTPGSSERGLERSWVRGASPPVTLVTVSFEAQAEAALSASYCAAGLRQISRVAV